MLIINKVIDFRKKNICSFVVFMDSLLKSVYLRRFLKN